MSVCAVIVTFHPAKEILNNVAAILDQVDEVVIVDNGSGIKERALLSQLARHNKVSIEFLQENFGIAAALNIGIKQAKARGHQWAITFDQDSQATVGMIAAMFQAYETYPDKEKVASLSPRYKSWSDETTIVPYEVSLLADVESSKYAEAEEVITSGNLIKLSILDSVGYFCETLFIDYVDIEYCLRCVTQGYKILEVKDALLIHEIGFPTRHKFLWKRPATSNHSALRRYYMARNAVYVYKKYLFKKPSWVIGNARALAKTLAVIFFFEDGRSEKLRAFLLGILDGLLNRMGKCHRTI